MAKGDFNELASPKAKTVRFKIYAEVDGELELQGKGITSWNIEQNQEVTSETDVLGEVDNTRGTAKPTQSIDTFKFRKDSKLGKLVFGAFYSGDQSALDAVDLYQKFEFVDGDANGDTCLARKLPETLINITSFTAEADSDITVAMDLYYSGKIVPGTMSKADGATPTFTPDTPAAQA